MKKIALLITAGIFTAGLTFAKGEKKETQAASVSTDASVTGPYVPIDQSEPTKTIIPVKGANKTAATPQQDYWVRLSDAINASYPGTITSFGMRPLWPDTTVKFVNDAVAPATGTVTRFAGSGRVAGGLTSYPYTGFNAFGQILDPSTSLFNYAATPGYVEFDNTKHVTVDSVNFSYVYNRYVDGSSDSAVATGTVTIANNDSTASDTIWVDGTGLAEGTDWHMLATDILTADSFAKVINNNYATVTAAAAGAVVTITAANFGSAGNSIALGFTPDPSTGTNGVTISGATLTGGEDFVAPVPDTLRVWIMGSAGILNGGTPTGNVASIRYDAASHFAQNTGVISKQDFLLTDADTTVRYVSGITTNDLNTITVGFNPTTLDFTPNLEKIGVVMKFIPGVSYTPYVDTFYLNTTEQPNTSKGGYYGKHNVFGPAAFDESQFPNSGTLTAGHDADYEAYNGGQWINGIQMQNGLTSFSASTTWQGGFAIHHLWCAWHLVPIGAQFSASGSSGGNCRVVTFTNESNVGGTPTYSWNFGDPASGIANTSTDENPTHDFTASGKGDYDVTVTVSGAEGIFTYSEQISLNWCIGMEDNDLNAGLEIYPNPAKGQLFIDYSVDDAQDLEIMIYDMQGKVAFASAVANVTSYNNTIDVSMLSAGSYLLKLQNDNGLLTKQITIAE